LTNFKTLASAGFYYDGNPHGRVYCFSCDFELSNLLNVSEAFDRHKTATYCDFINGFDVSIGRASDKLKILGIPLVADKEDLVPKIPAEEEMLYTLETPTYKIAPSGYMRRRSRTIYGAVKIPALDDSSMMLRVDAFFNHMKYEKNRLETFKIGNYREETPTLELLAITGFFYTLLNDTVQCAFCRIIFCVTSQSYSHIEFMHALYSPDCPHVMDESNNVQLEEIDESPLPWAEQINERLLCKVCAENEVSVVLNCKHLVLCAECADEPRMDRCPVCRAQILFKHKIFLS